MVQKHRREYPSRCEPPWNRLHPRWAVCLITLHDGVKRSERDAGVRQSVTTSEVQRVKDLEREVKELRRANEILNKAELIHRRAVWKTKEAVGLATLEWVPRFNHHRLLESIGYVPPAEAEANHYRQLASQATTVAG